VARFYGPRCGNFSALFSEHTHGMLVETLKLTNHAENASPDGPLTLLTRTQAHRFRRWRCDLCLLLVFLPYYLTIKSHAKLVWLGRVQSFMLLFFWSGWVISLVGRVSSGQENWTHVLLCGTTRLRCYITTNMMPRVLCRRSWTDWRVKFDLTSEEDVNRLVSTWWNWR